MSQLSESADSLTDAIDRHTHKFDEIHRSVQILDNRVVKVETTLEQIGQAVNSAKGAVWVLVVILGMLSAIAGWAVVKAVDADSRSQVNERALEIVLDGIRGRTWTQ